MADPYPKETIDYDNDLDLDEIDPDKNEELVYDTSLYK